MKHVSNFNRLVHKFGPLDYSILIYHTSLIKLMSKVHCTLDPGEFMSTQYQGNWLPQTAFLTNYMDALALGFLRIGVRYYISWQNPPQ